MFEPTSDRRTDQLLLVVSTNCSRYLKYNIFPSRDMKIKIKIADRTDFNELEQCFVDFLWQLYLERCASAKSAYRIFFDNSFLPLKKFSSVFTNKSLIKR